MLLIKLNLLKNKTSKSATCELVTNLVGVIRMIDDCICFILILCCVLEKWSIILLTMFLLLLLK